MPEKRKNGRRGWNLLLAAHLFVYVIFWCLALYALNMSAPLTEFVGAVLLWLPILGLHVVAYVTSDKRSASPDAERQAYREGFTDAMKHLADRSYDTKRLALDDEGELMEFQEKHK